MADQSEATELSRATEGMLSHGNEDDASEDLSVGMLQRINNDQAEQIETLQQQMNASQVKHSEEVYWLRLELDSSRREKEAVEDRLEELYRGVQELLTGNQNENEGSSQTDDLCTEPDYVRALQERLTAYERSVEILNRQIDMMKASSDVVVTSMKQEVTDLVEEKSHMERDLLNQLSNLDNAKRRVECQLSAYREQEKQGRVEGVAAPTMASSGTTTDCVEPSSQASDSAPPPAQEDGAVPLEESESAEMPYEEVSAVPDAPAVESGKVQEESFRSTATTQGSSFTHDVTPSAPIFLNDESSETLRDNQSKQNQSYEIMCDEVSKWKEEAGALKIANQKLQGKVEEITKELLFTRSSANVALALDRIETDRAETIAHLDRIAVLWDRADSTIQVMEGLLSEFQPRPSSPECHPSNQMDRERLLSTLETATLVHGQIKMSLMLIELTFRNHLTCIQNDNLQELQNIVVSDKLEQVRTDTLSAIAKAETKWTVAVEQVEQQILADTQSTNESLRVQLGELQQAQDRQKLLERELQEFKKQPPPQAGSEIATQGMPGKAEDQGGDPAALSPVENSSGFVVSRSVLFKLQKEVLSVVAVVEERNEAIRLLMETIDKHKLREDLLKKELKRAKPTQRKVKTKDRIIVERRNTLDLPKVPRAATANSGSAKKSTSTSSKEKADPRQPGKFPLLPAPKRSAAVVVRGKSKPSSPHSHANTRPKSFAEPNRGWSSL